MKVCTDACLFGAWLSDVILKNDLPGTNALDIGAGTGLLSLMMAQGHEKLRFDAVEIDQSAFEQASENVMASSFCHQIQLHHSSLQTFHADKKYDLIFSNPPFYENDLRSDSQGKNRAKHDESLTLAALATYIHENLAESGKVAILIPYHRFIDCKEIFTKQGLFVNELMHVKQSVSHTYFRSMILFSREQKSYDEDLCMAIKKEDNQYTDSFTALLKTFYLHL